MESHHCDVMTMQQLSTQKESHHFTIAAFLFLLYITLGALYLMFTDKSLSFIDALYFLVVSFTTTGYGDIIPSNGGSRAVVCMLIILGIITMGYFASVFSDVLANKLYRQDIKRDRRVVMFLKEIGKARNLAIEKANSKTGLFRYFIKRLQHLLHWLNTQRTALKALFHVKTSGCMESDQDTANLPESDDHALKADSTADVPQASIDDIKEMNAQSFKYEIKKANAKAFYSIVCIVLTLLFGSLIMSEVEEWRLLDAFYWAIVTITTVGYGDITPSSIGGKIFCIIYILVGSLIVARALSVFIQYPLLARRQRLEFKVLDQFINLPAETLIALKNSIHQGAYKFLRPSGSTAAATHCDEINKAEFVIVLLSTMNKLSKQDVMLASRVFDSLDISKNGIISSDVLDKEVVRATEREERVVPRPRSGSVTMVPVFSPLISNLNYNEASGTCCSTPWQ